MANERDIPDGIKRAVRQRCGFGCVICGVPVYHYDHIIGWAATERHVEAEITLLCGLHHDLKTRQQLSQQTVERHNADPFNRRAGVTAPFGLDFGGARGTIRLAGSTFTYDGDFVAIVIDDNALLGFRHAEDGLALRFVLCNEFNEPELFVDDSVLVVDTRQWDIQYEGQVLTVRRGHRKISLRVRFTPPDTIDIEKTVIALNGIAIEADANGLTLGSDPSLGGVVDGYFHGPVGINAGHSPRYGRLSGGLRYARVDRYGGRIQWASEPCEPGAGSDDGVGADPRS